MYKQVCMHMNGARCTELGYSFADAFIVPIKSAKARSISIATHFDWNARFMVALIQFAKKSGSCGLFIVGFMLLSIFCFEIIF